jgi:thiamine biosynthesis lipoprotein
MMSALHRTEWRAVGTTCAAAVTVRSDDEREVNRALGAAQEEVAACERELSRFDPASDLSRLNAAGGRWTPIGRRLLEALELALQAREETGGRFDPTVLPALAAAGYDRSFELLEEHEARWADGWRAGTAIELDTRNGCARLEPGTSVDLGGIGKGYAAGRALAAMLVGSPTLAGGLVDLGGDIAVRGESPEGGPWLVAVADPRRAGETLAVLALDAGGVATSGRNARRFGPGRSLHHLIDPETGESALAGPLTVTVVAPDPVAAEVHATTLAIAGPAEAREHVTARPGISALYVPQVGPVIPIGRLPLVSERLVVRAA